MPSKILNFNKDRLITGINIIDGMLFFTDDHTEPKKINIEKFKGNFDGVTVDHSSGTTNIYGRPFEERDITVIKEHPKKALNSSLQSNTIDVVDDDGGGGDILVDGDLTWTGFEISKSLDTIFRAEGDTLQNLLMHGNVATITPLSEIGFYYTFDESLIDNAANISANLNNGVYKISAPEAVSGSVKLGISNISTDVNYQSALANVSNGDKIFYVLYAIEAGGTGDPVFAVENNGDLDIVSKTIGDAASQPTGVISDLEVNVQVTSFIGGKKISIEATYSKDSYVRVQQNGFLISAERIAGSGESVPTATEVRDEIRDQEGSNVPIYTDDDGTKSLFPKALNNSVADIDGRFFPERSIDASRLTTGSIYYVYAYVDTENSTQGRVYSAVPGIIKIGADVSNEAPSLYHKPPGTHATYVNFEARIVNAGSNATLSERGFIFSTVENDLNNIKTLTFDPTTYQATGGGAPSNTYKVPVPITAGTNGLNEDYSLFTNNPLFFNNGALSTNETVYYVAYATNDRGQIAYAPRTMSIGEAVGLSPTLGQGRGMERVTTVANVEPKISINHFTTYKINSDRHRVLSLGFDVDSIPDNTKVDAIGLVYAYPSGDSPEYGINETNLAASGALNGFHKENDGYNKIDNSPTSVTIESSQFTYTGSDPNNQIGNYKIEYNSKENENIEDLTRYKELFPESFFGPFNAGFSYYAYIIYDGQKYFSNIRTGAFSTIISNTGSGFTTGSCSGSRIGAPTMWFGGVDPAKKHLPENPTTSVTLYASMCPNANKSTNALIEMGFYWSYEKIEGTTVNPEKLEEWAAKSSTNKVTIPVTSTQQDPRGSGTVQATNWTSIVSGANGPELYGDKKFHLETTITIPAGKEGQYIYWTPFNLIRRTGVYNFPGIEGVPQDPPIKFGRGLGYGEGLASVQIGKTITSIDVEPNVVIKRIDANASYPNFIGKAEEGSQNYTISKKGFYYKPSTSFSSTAEADVKTEMQSPTNRSQLFATNLPKGQDYSFKPASALPNGTYYVSAFCEIIIGGTTYTRISDNYKSITINVSTNTTLNTTPELRSEIYSGQVQMNGRITKNTSDIVTKGFYVIKKQGQNSISLTRTGVGLKSVFDSPPAGVTTANEVSTTTGSYFSKSITSFQKGYTYIYAAYATNSKGETGISNNITELFISDNTPSKIETVPSNYNTIYIDSEGYPCSDSGFNRPVLGGDLFIEIATEKNTADNWRIKSTQKWSDSNLGPRITKRLKNGTYFLNIGRQRINQSAYEARAGVTLENTTDITKQLRIEIIQQGVGTGFNDNADNLDWFKDTADDENNFRY